MSETDTNRFFDEKVHGELITQIHVSEWDSIVGWTFQEDLDIEALLSSEKKKDRILGRKVACLIMAFSQATSVMCSLPKEWRTLYFRKHGRDGIDLEVLG